MLKANCFIYNNFFILSFFYLLILFIFSDCSEEIRVLVIVSVGNGGLSTVADDEGPIVSGDSCYGFHSAGTGRAF